MTKEERLKLQIAACKVRMGVIESTHGAKAGHPGGSLSAADMFTYLYNKEMRVDPTNPKWENRDRFVLSKGHTAPGLYSALAYRGFFPVEDLPTLRRDPCGTAEHKIHCFPAFQYTLPSSPPYRRLDGCSIPLLVQKFADLGFHGTHLALKCAGGYP